MNWRIFLVHLDALFVCRFLMRCLFVCLHDDNDDEKSDARFNSLSLSLSLSLVAAVFIAFFWLRVVVCFLTNLLPLSLSHNKTYDSTKTIVRTERTRGIPGRLDIERVLQLSRCYDYGL
jgi:hypothetical protein